MPKALRFFLDVYVPNEGDPDTALEIGVLFYDGKQRPGVYLHSFLRPATPNRVRWSNALMQGIKRNTVLKDPTLPSLKDIVSANFLKGKTVVCLNPNLEPCKSLVKDSRSHGIIATWQEIFKHDDNADKLLRPSQMLEFLGLPAFDESPAGYTPLLCRLQSLIAIWEYLSEQKRFHKNAMGSQLSIPLNLVWPIPYKENNLLYRQVQDFSDIADEEISAFFSPALPDYLDWFKIKVYSHDWVFRRGSSADINSLNGRISMCEYIFTKVLNFNMRLWVLIFYSIYDHKTDYAREIALNRRPFSKLPPSVKEDFTIFLISHLEDFLTHEQKENLIRAMVRQTLSDKNQEPLENYDYVSLKKAENTSLTFNEYGPENTNLKNMLEIRDKNNELLYRQYEIFGSDEERDSCADFINKEFRSFLREAQNPFSPLWLPVQLRNWLQFITGIPFALIKREPSYLDEERVSQTRRFLIRLLEEENYQYRLKLQTDLKEAVLRTSVNLSPREDFESAFTFQGITYKVIVRREKHSFLGRILNF